MNPPGFDDGLELLPPLFLLPLLILLPRFIGIEGIMYSGPIADFSAATVSIIMGVLELYSLNRKEHKEELVM